jgi:hypothetical protein
MDSTSIPPRGRKFIAGDPHDFHRRGRSDLLPQAGCSRWRVVVPSP